MSGDDVRKDYGYTMGVVNEADVYSPYSIDEKITSSWPSEPQRTYILPESDPELYKNYMDYALQQDTEGIYVHDQEMVDSALAYQNYLTKHSELQDITRDSYFFSYDVPHLILPNQLGTRTEMKGQSWDFRADAKEGETLWGDPQFQDPKFRAEYGSKDARLTPYALGMIGSSPALTAGASALGVTGVDMELYDIIEKLEAAPQNSAIAKVYQEYLASVPDAEKFVGSVQSMRDQDLKRYTAIREAVDYKGKGFGEGDVSKFG